MNYDSLNKYFSSQFSSLPSSPQIKNSVQSLLGQVSSRSSESLQHLKLKIMKSDQQNKLKLDIYKETNPGLNEIKGLELEIEHKYEIVREMEKEIEEIRKKIEIIDEYEQYLEEYRKPGFKERIENIEFFATAKKESLSYINSILNDKKRLHLDSGKIVAKIQELYQDIEKDEKLLADLNKIVEKQSRKKMMKGKAIDPNDGGEGSNDTIRETSGEYSKNEISSSRSQVMLTSLCLNGDTIGNQDISHISKNNLTIKIQEMKKSANLELKKGFDSKPNSKHRIKLPELSRANQERLAIIEGRQRYGESFHNQISPTLERVKRQEKDNKVYFSPGIRLLDHHQKSYKSLSPKPGFNL